MHLRANGQLGLTLVELMVVIVIGAIILIAIAFAFSGVHQSFAKTRDHSTVRQDILVAKQLIRNRVRESISNTLSVADEGTTLNITPDGGAAEAIKKVGNDLAHQDGAETRTVISGRLSELLFELVPGHDAGTTLLNVVMTVTSGDASSTASFTTGLRNRSET